MRDRVQATGVKIHVTVSLALYLEYRFVSLTGCLLGHSSSHQGLGFIWIQVALQYIPAIFHQAYQEISDIDVKLRNVSAE